MISEPMRERVYLLPHRPAPTARKAILWTHRTPRPLPVVFSVTETLVEIMPGGDVKCWYDADELARGLAIWASEFGVRLDAAAIVREVFGDNHVN